MPANPRRYINLAQLDPATGSINWQKLVHPYPDSVGGIGCYWMEPVADGSGDMLVSSRSSSSHTCLTRVDTLGYNKWCIDGVRVASNYPPTFGYDDINGIIVAVIGYPAQSYEIRGIDPADGSTMWSRSFPVYPSSLGVDSLCVRGSKCIVCMEPFPGSNSDVRQIDTTTGADIWVATQTGRMRISNIDSSGNWISSINETFAPTVRDGTNGSLIGTGTYGAYSFNFDARGYSGTHRGSGPTFTGASLFACAGGTSLTKAFDISAIAGGTASSFYTSCSEPGPNYFFGGAPLAGTVGAYFNVVKTDGSGSLIWAKNVGLGTVNDQVFKIAMADDGTLWTCGPVVEA